MPELVKAIEQLDEEKFPKLMAYLNNPISQRVRTNNHVERTNRMFRLLGRCGTSGGVERRWSGSWS